MRFLQKIIYYACFLTYKITVKISHPEVKSIWYRNSFATGYWVFLKSDIDITVVFERATKKLINEINHTHSLFRRFMPVIGELVIFSEHHKYDLLTCVNSFELERDPTLIEKYYYQKKGDHYEKIVFLHKFILSNWTKKDLDTIRKDKIAYVSKLLGLDGNKNFLELIDDLSSLLGVDKNQFKADYVKELNNRSENLIYYKNELPDLILAIFYNQLCYLKPDHQLSVVEKKIIEKTLLWELWGAFSFQASIPATDLKIHINRLTLNLEQLTSAEFAREFNEHVSRLGLR